MSSSGSTSRSARRRILATTVRLTSLTGQSAPAARVRQR
jgi:hypothetical protein